MPPEEPAIPQPEPEPEAGSKASPAPREPRRAWVRRFFRILLLVLLLLAVFHRPIFHTVMRLVLIRVAARQNVTLDVHFAGSIFTNLDVRDVSAFPTGKAPSPVEKITIESVRLEYSLPTLFRRGVGEFLKSYEIKNADLRFLAYPSTDEEERKQKHSLAEDLNNLLAQPALYADRVRVENLNVRVTSPDNVTDVEGVHLFLDPEQVGYLRVARLKVPGLPAWENLSAETSYAQRNLYLRGLVLSPELVLKEVNFDASQRSQKRGSLMVNAAAFGGSLKLTVEGSQLPKKGENLQNSYATNLSLQAQGVDMHAAAAYFGKKDLPIGRLEELQLQATGEPERPRTWNGTASLKVGNVAPGNVKIDAIGANLVFENGTAKVTAGTVSLGESKVSLQGVAQLPESVNDFASTEGDADLQIDAPDLLDLTSKFIKEDPLGGVLTGTGKVGYHQHRLTADLKLKGNRIGNAGLGLGKASVQLSAAKQLDEKGDSPMHGLESKISAELTNLRYKTFTADSASIDAETQDELVTIHRGEIVRGENRVDVKGTYRITFDEKNAAPLNADFSVHVPNLEEFGIRLKDATVSGAVNGRGSVKTVKGALQGSIDLQAPELAIGDFKTQGLVAKIAVEDDTASIEEFRLKIHGEDQIAATGKIELKKPLSYEGALLVLIKNLTVLQPLLSVLGIEEPVSGSVDLSVEGKGQLQPQRHEGQLKLLVDKAKYGNIDLKEVRLSGLYAPEFAESTELRVVSGVTSLEGVMEWRDSKLKLRDITLRQGTQQALSGYVIIPFDPLTPGALVPLEKRIAANVNAKDLDLEKLMGSLGKPSPATGTVTANLVAGGTFLRPTFHLKLAARQLKAKAAAEFDAAELDLTAHYSEKELTLDALLKQRQIQPLTVKGRVPLDLEAALQQKKLDPDLPLDLSVRLPSTSLAFVSKVVPAIRRIEGTAGIEAHVGGTVEKPVFTGAASLKVEYARLANEGAPALGRIVADIGFANDGLRIRSLRGEVGGGTFDLTGGIQVPRWFEPVLNLRLRSDDVLVKRDDSVTVRIDTDVTATGPLKAGLVRGTVWVTQSRFFRDIDILPIGLPGRPKPKPAPKSAPSEASFSITTPPLRDWTFDVAIKTRPNDPFQIRGNLANGGAAFDLHLGGTGLAPYLEGSIRVDNFVASLPFSKLTVTRGFITFSRDAPFEPKLDIQAQSELRDYRISAYIYGSSKDPQLSLTSEPPLPQQDIISLLATGTTTSELTGSSDVLAGRAAVLLFQQLYRKIFKQKDPAENVPFLDRFKVDIGTVDNRTGRQEISATLKLGENFYLVGDVDVAGEFAGRIRYLVRFR